jgi:transposase
MSRNPVPVVSESDRRTLESWVRSASIPAGLARRARIVLLAADGAGTNEIVAKTGSTRPTVTAWRNRFIAEGVAGLDDRRRKGREPEIDQIEVINATLQAPPDQLGITHWSSRILGKQLGISNVTVAKIWRRWGIKPYRQETFKFSTDPELEAKIRDVVGLYLDPPENAIVLSIDESGRAGARHHS